MSSRDTRWESISASIIPRTIETAGQSLVHLCFSATAWSDRDGEWKTLSVYVEEGRLAKYEWLYDRTLDLIVRDLESWNPR